MPLTEKMKIVLLPSTRDVHLLPVFPQPAMHVTATENTVFMDNPSMFSCQNSSFGVVTTDVLMALSSQELRKGAMADRLAGLANKLIDQARYVPRENSPPSSYHESFKSFPYSYDSASLAYALLCMYGRIISMLPDLFHQA